MSRLVTLSELRLPTKSLDPYGNCSQRPSLTYLRSSSMNLSYLRCVSAVQGWSSSDKLSPAAILYSRRLSRGVVPCIRFTFAP